MDTEDKQVIAWHYNFGNTFYEAHTIHYKGILRHCNECIMHYKKPYNKLYYLMNIHKHSFNVLYYLRISGYIF